ncbi:MAG: UV damage endonuclease UvsE, partial [Proteobacteria bacterium]|nr:UV damage endonuclease UvsE [Pseudomonadota bacterium]
KQKLRAHSHFYWNDALNDYIKGFLPIADIMAESKAKNLASFQLASQIGLV